MTRRQRRRQRAPRLLALDDALTALGRDGQVGRRTADVPVVDIIGSAHRAADFDEAFRLVNPALQDRWQRLHEAMHAGAEPPPVRLVQLGELYFVMDGHHRVSVARSLGRRWLTAHVLQLCTVAYAACCLGAAHLPSKAAERRFLERVPLPDGLRRELWLDHPSHWSRLSDAAEAWGLRRAHQRSELPDRGELAVSWWHEEVEPLVRRLRDAGAGVDLPDVELYVTALAVRDDLGETAWEPELVRRVAGRVRAADEPARRRRLRRRNGHAPAR